MQTQLLKYCSLASRENGERLCGTAPYYEHWILLEYRRPWRKKAVEDNQLPEEVKAHLSGALTQLSNARMLFIKQEQRRGPEKKLFVVAARSDRCLVREFCFTNYRDLLNIDMPAAVREEISSGMPHPEPLYLVCTNGKRDKCCAKFGWPVYHTLRALGGDAVWQCTHLGGHRFAPTMVAFPPGAALGRVRHEALGEILAKLRHGEIPLDCFRGRVFFPAYVQAAEYYLMEKTGRANPAEFALRESRQISADRWLLLFVDPHGHQHEITVEQYFQTPAMRSTCDADNPKALAQCRLIDYRPPVGRENSGQAN